MSDRAHQHAAETLPGEAEEAHGRLSLLDVPLSPSAAGELPSGRRVLTSFDGGSEYVHVASPRGRIELTIRFTEAGPIIDVDAVALRLAAKTIDLECEDLRAHARSIELTCTGDMTEEVRGKRRLSSAGGTRIEGREIDVVAERGETRIEAASDLRIDGRNVLINC
jgi:hypothetical protein